MPLPVPDTLVVLCAGRDSLHRSNRWTVPGLRDFELWLLLYEPSGPETPEAPDKVVHMTGTKTELLRAMAPAIAARSADWTWFPDDDIAIDVTQVNAFFRTCAAAADSRSVKALMQPSLAPRNASHPCLVHQPGDPLHTRNVPLVEIQMPCISAALLPRILKMYTDNPQIHSGWGMDIVWSSWPDIVKMVSNTEVAVHTRPVSLTRGYYKALEKSPAQEMADLLKKYARPPNETY